MIMKTKTGRIELNLEGVLKEKIIFETAFDQIRAQYSAIYIIFLEETIFTIH